MSYNPGYAGSSGSICAALMYRNQWLGLHLDAPNANAKAGSTPQDVLFTFDMPVKFLHGGLGLNVVKDMIGYHDNISASLDYAFRMFWGEGNLSAGAEVSLMSSKLDKASIIAEDPNDPVLAGLGESATLIDAGVGIYYQVPGKYYVGVSVKNLLGAHSDEIMFTNARTAYAMGGFEYVPSSAPSVRIKPSALLKTANLSYFQADLTCLIDYRNAFWGGLGYRVQDAVYALAGIHWKKLQVGVSYDFTTSRLGAYKFGRSMGSIELYMKFCFKVVVPRKPNTSYGNTIMLE
jgi:type IX secretion system PorP/SprF family membrane protein